MGLTPYYTDPGGRATIFCGDTLLVLSELVDAEVTVDALITDPPYSSGGQYRGDRVQSTLSKYVNHENTYGRTDFGGDNRDQRAYLAWVSLWMAAALQLAEPGAVAALFSDWRQTPTTTDALQAGGWVWRGLGVWDKGQQARPALGGMRPQAEYIVWGTAGPALPGRNPVVLPGVFSSPALRGDDKLHIAQKPLGVMRWLCQLCPPDGLILDPFMGSGTTLRAALDTGRRVIGIDHDEANCAIAAERPQQVALMALEA